MNRLLTILWLLLSSPFALANPFPVTVDSCGKPITFNQPPQRAVINDLNMAEMAFALDLQDRIVGLTASPGTATSACLARCSTASLPCIPISICLIV